MRVLLLANPGGLADEGARNVSRAFAAGLRQRHELLLMTASSAATRLAEIRRFNPQIVHSLHGPSARTFAMMAVLHWVVPGAALLASLSQTGSAFDRVQPLLRRLRFVRLLSQDPVSEAFFARLGFSVSPLPNGVDVERFRPAPPSLPRNLEGALASDRPILMHIGHLKPNRGLDTLAQLSGYHGWQVLIVGSPAMPPAPGITEMLRAAGCIVMRDFVENMPGLYCAVDAYAFPVSNWTGAIDMPLSVLEAMACNRPVLSTPFKALPRFLPEGDGLYYFRSTDEARAVLDRITDCPRVATREIIAAYSWDNILLALEDVYTACLRG